MTDRPQHMNPAFISPATEWIAHGEPAGTQKQYLDCFINGQKYSYENAPALVMDIIRAELKRDQGAMKWLRVWKEEEGIDELMQYTFCTMGGYDPDPDIDENGVVNANEYHDCGMRGICRFEGKVCRGLKVGKGVLTKTQVEFVRRAHKPNKIIAGEMFISEETVNSHSQNVMEKTGLTRGQLTVLAALKGIILW